MIIYMRTTLILEDQLLKRAKQRAVAQNSTLSDLVNQALREMLSRPREEAAPFSMITFGDPSAPVQHEPADFAAAMEDDDRRSIVR